MVLRYINFADNKKNTPETIQSCNAARYRVDVLNQNAGLYTTKVASRRWPLLVIFVLNVSASDAPQ